VPLAPDTFTLALAPTETETELADKESSAPKTGGSHSSIPHSAVNENPCDRRIDASCSWRRRRRVRAVARRRSCRGATEAPNADQPVSSRARLPALSERKLKIANPLRTPAVVHGPRAGRSGRRTPSPHTAVARRGRAALGNALPSRQMATAAARC
jgi:hypothetical protein